MTHQTVSKSPLKSDRRNRHKRRAANTALAGACIAAASMTAGLVMLMEPADLDRMAQQWPFVAGMAVMPAPPAPVPVFAPVLARLEQEGSLPAQTVGPVVGKLDVAQPPPQLTGRLASKPTAEQTVYLVRATLIALDHANRTGNYSVLRELASTNFQLKNAADHLAHVFSGMRRSHIDMTAAALQQPHWLSPPALTPDNALSLRGTMSALPSPVAFDVRFSIEEGIWKLDAIEISPAKTQISELEQ